METIELEPLTPRQKKFVAEYLVDRNGAAAAVRAGYSPNGAKVTACRLLTKTNLRALLEAREREEAERLRLSREAVLKELLSAARLARQRENPGEMVRAWREVGRFLGYYAPEVRSLKVRVAPPRDHELKYLSDAELLEAASTLSTPSTVGWTP